MQAALESGACDLIGMARPLAVSPICPGDCSRAPRRPRWAWSSMRHAGRSVTWPSFTGIATSWRASRAGSRRGAGAFRCSRWRARYCATRSVHSAICARPSCPAVRRCHREATLNELPPHLLRGRQTRENVMTHAVLIATREGLEALTIGRVAESAGIAKASVLGHYGTKEQLQLATLEAGSRAFVAAVIVPTSSLPEGIVRLRGLVERWVEQIGRGRGWLPVCLGRRGVRCATRPRARPHPEDGASVALHPARPGHTRHSAQAAESQDRSGPAGVLPARHAARSQPAPAAVRRSPGHQARARSHRGAPCRGSQSTRPKASYNPTSKVALTNPWPSSLPVSSVACTSRVQQRALATGALIECRAARALAQPGAHRGSVCPSKCGR